MESYFSEIGENVDSVDEIKIDGEVIHSYPATLKISNAYKAFIHIVDERQNKTVNVIAVCPKELDFTFSNTWGSIDPFKMSGGSWLQAGIQSFGGKAGPLSREVSTIHYWSGSSPLEMPITIQLYAEKPEEVEERIFKPLKILANLAQPSTKKDSGILIPPGPSPLQFNIKFKGKKLKKVIEEDKSETLELDLDAQGNTQMTDYNIGAGKGVRTDIKIGSWFYLTDVLVNNVKINIPMNLAKQYRKTTGTMQSITKEKNTNVKDNENRAEKIQNLTNRNNAINETLKTKTNLLTETKHDKNMLTSAKESIKSYTEEIKKGTDQKNQLQASMSNSATDMLKQQTLSDMYTVSMQTATNSLEFVQAKNMKDLTDAKVKSLSSEVQSYNTQIKSVTSKIATAEKGLESAKSLESKILNKYGSEKKLDNQIEDLTTEVEKTLPDEKKKNNENIDKLNSETESSNAVITEISNALNRDSQAKPFMASITLSVKTRYQITQNDFNLMLSGVPNQKKFIDWDLRDSSIGSALLNLSTSALAVDAVDLNGRKVEKRVVEKVASQVATKSNISLAHDAKKKNSKK